MEGKPDCPVLVEEFEINMDVTEEGRQLLLQAALEGAPPLLYNFTLEAVLAGGQKHVLSSAPAIHEDIALPPTWRTFIFVFGLTGDVVAEDLYIKDGRGRRITKNLLKGKPFEFSAAMKSFEIRYTIRAAD